MKYLVYLAIILIWGLLLFLTGWDGASPDYYRLEIVARIFMLVVLSGFSIGLIELGRWIGKHHDND